MSPAVSGRKPSNLPKAVHEALCLAQSALADRARQGVDVDRVLHSIEQIQVLINAVEQVRPLGIDGKHGDLHGPACGCEGRMAPWSIPLYPEEDDHG